MLDVACGKDDIIEIWNWLPRWMMGFNMRELSPTNAFGRVSDSITKTWLIIIVGILSKHLAYFYKNKMGEYFSVYPRYSKRNSPSFMWSYTY